MPHLNAALLRPIADGETSFGLEHPDDPAAGAEFDALVTDLQALYEEGLITRVVTQPNGLSSHSRYNAAAVPGGITEDGRAALRNVAP